VSELIQPGSRQGLQTLAKSIFLQLHCFVFKASSLSASSEDMQSNLCVDTMVGVHYRPPDQEKEVDETFYRQLKVTSQ